MALDKRYDSQEAEPRIQQDWDESGIFEIDWSSDKELFSIDTPPPTMSGRMHLGHAFSYSQGDFIARYKRMRGFNVVYPWGTDDNGLPTERLVEKAKGVRASKMPREEFAKEVLDYVKEHSESFTAQWKRLGISCDFSSAYSTIDPHCQATSQKSFLDLHEKGLVFRKKTPVSWCVSCRTAIAQADFESFQKSSKFHEIAFSGPDGQDLIIGTTRPELLPACVALAAHPDDARYEALEGKKAVVPLFDYEVPIVYDEDADPELGTGLMMVCTFGDKEDVEKWYRHDLELRTLIGEDGRLTDLAGEYAGMRIEEARKAIVESLETRNVLKSSKTVSHATNVHDRCGTPIEFLHTEQWFINVLGFKDELLQMGEEIEWYPEFMHARYKHWVENLGWDWCISRQRHFGVPFPVWYDKDGNVVVAEESDLPIDPAQDVPAAWKDRADELTPESDVLDTWATSSVTPQIVADWLGSDDFEERFPMSLRLQAHDIIRTWAFYTIVKSLHQHGVPPWKEIVISGHGLDSKGKKMSKSKGNVIEPGVKIKQYSADAVRYWASGTKLGEDLSFQEKDLVTGQKTVNKLWNASRFATMHLEEYDGSLPEKLEVVDRWILAKFALVVDAATESLDRYEYNQAKLAVDNFFWNVFCDYYLEFVKDRLYNEDTRGAEGKRSAQYTLYSVLLGTLKLWAPIMPHVTEAIYTQFFAAREEQESIHVSGWPVAGKEWRDDLAASAGDVLSEALAQVRKWKSEHELSLGAQVSAVELAAPSKVQALVKQALLDFQGAARADKVDVSVGEVVSVSVENQNI